MWSKIFYDYEIVAWPKWRFELFMCIRKGIKPNMPNWVYHYQPFKFFWFMILVFVVFRIVAVKKIEICERIGSDSFELLYK